MNELAYYLDRCFAELESQETLAVEGTGFLEDVTDATLMQLGKGKKGIMLHMIGSLVLANCGKRY